MMAGGFAWEPASAKEIAYYDKLFKVVDRDKNKKLDGQETVKFLSFSGLSKAQLKDVWCVAVSPGQASLEPKAFYVAMRAVALAQSGESTLNRKRLRETATDTIPMATFKGCPKPPIKNSQGKKPPPREPQNNASKKSDKGMSDFAAEKRQPGRVKKGTDAPAGGKAIKAQTDNQAISVKGTEVGPRETNDERLGKKGTHRVMSSAKQTRRRAYSSGSPSTSSGAIPDSTNTGSSTAGSGTDGDESGRDNKDGGVVQESGRNLRVSARSSSGDKHSDSSSDSEGDANNRSGSSRGTDEDSVETASVAADVEGGRQLYAARVGDKKVVSEKPSSSSPRSSSSSSPGSGSGIGPTAEDDVFVMTDKARAKYKAIFTKLDASGAGSLSGRQAAGLFAKSGLGKTVLAKIWRLSDLDDNGDLSAEEFGIAFHLIFCVTQKKLHVPDELPPSLWPAGYTPPSVLARRKEEAKRKHQHERQEATEKDRRQKERGRGGTSRVSVEGGTLAAESIPEGKDDDGGGDGGGGKTAGGKNNRKKIHKSWKNRKKGDTDDVETKASQERQEEGRQKEHAAREVSAQQKKEELARKPAQRKDRNTAGKSKKTRKNIVNGGSSPTTVNIEEIDESKMDSKEGAHAAGLADVVRDSDAGDNAGALGGDKDDGNNDGSNKEKTRIEKNKKGRRPSRAGAGGESERRDSLDVAGSGRNRGEEDAVGVGLSPAERRARKARARAARLEESRRKKEIAARDARLAALDKEDDFKGFSVKEMAPMRTSQDDSRMNLLSEPAGEDVEGDGAPPSLSFARLSAPLPYLALRRGCAACLETHEFSVSFPSGIRRGSALTSSLDIRLGPPAPAQIVDGATNSVADDGGADAGKDGKEEGGGEEAGMTRCPECAEVLPSAQIVRHIRSTCRLLPCPLCPRLLLPAAREAHLTEACPNRRRSCMGCGEAVALSGFASHDKDGVCSQRAVPCALCGEFCLTADDELKKHEATGCPEREVLCSSCGDAVPARLLAEHVSSLCREISWTCGCGKGPIPLLDRGDHLKNCEAFLDAWEASIEQVIAQMPKISVIRNIGKVMILTRVEDPVLALLAFAECRGNAGLAARRITDERGYLDELVLASEMVNVQVFLNALKKPGKRGAGALWREGV